MKINSFTSTRLQRAAPTFFTYAIPIALFSLMPLLVDDNVAIAFAALIVALWQIFWRSLAAMFVVLPLCLGISLTNTIKSRYTGESLIWQDFAYALPNLRENLGMLIQYVEPAIFVAVLLWILAGVIVTRLERRYLPHSGVGSGMFVALMALLYLPTAWAAADEAIDGWPRLRDGNAWAFSAHHNYSALTRFVRSLAIGSAEFVYSPVGPDAFEKHPPVSAPVVSAAPRSPDIIAIFQESQFDPRQLSACAGRAECRLAMFEPGENSSQYGPLRVHVLGGATWNSELAFMTGIPHRWFSETGYAPYSVAPRIRNGLGHRLRALGYRTAVVYPVQKGMMNAYNAYRAYGMEEFHGAEMLGLPADWCEVTDTVMYAKLAEVRERLITTDSRPIFLVMLTIHNHGPHGGRCAAPENRSTQSQTTEEMLDRKVDDFIVRSRAADAANQMFRDKVLGGTRPTLMLVAGDHQPGFEGMASRLARQAHRPMRDNEALYFASYQFFTNYASSTKPLQRELDIMFLPSTLLEIAGLPADPFFAANGRLREICSGRLEHCPDGSFLDSYRHHLVNTGFFQ